ncbi:MAG: site-specific integrase [Acidobacteria bacterium]|jgi:integrase|nr:site-specific integrase [Acidobacteriota bacterium]
MALFRRPNSKYWWMKFTFDGSLTQQSTKCSNKRDALQVEGAYRHELALGRIGIEPKQKAPTFYTAIEDFLLWSSIEHANQPATCKRYYFSCQSLKNYFGAVQIDRIKKKNVEDFIAWRSCQLSKKTKKLITRKTVNFDLLVLKMIFKRLSDAKIIRDNPAGGIKTLSETEGENSFHVITPDEEKLYLMACPQPLQDVAILMLETGMRCGEVYQLRSQDIFVPQGFLKVVKGKTRSSVRRVHLSAAAQTVLSSRIQKFDGANLFPQNDRDGERATRTLNRIHLETVRKLKIKFRLYDCRHTFATRALESGVDLLTLASILGHTNLKMVSRYAHPSEQHKADAIRRMEKAKVEKRAKAV